MLEYGVPEETAPYLVSSSSSVMWISEPHPGPVVKAAVREVSLGDFFRECVDAVAAMGRQQEWGNVHLLTLEGLRAAIEHVSFYELEPLELLIPRAYPPGSSPSVEEDESEDDPQKVNNPGTPDLMPPDLRPLLEEVGLPFRPSAWVPANTVIVVPKDRAFVGVVWQVTPKKIAGVVHNAARGIAIASGGATGELAQRPSTSSSAG